MCDNYNRGKLLVDVGAHCIRNNYDTQLLKPFLEALGFKKSEIEDIISSVEAGICFEQLNLNPLMMNTIRKIINAAPAKKN